VQEKNDTPSAHLRTDDCPCTLPTFQDRADWCPNGDCPEITNPTITNVTHLIVHHSAGTNVSSNWAGVVRSIWDYHVNTNGWDDIGYNWLIDANGVIYQGRGDNVQGAHFCGQNGNTVGLCVLGDFTNTQPTSDATDALTKLLAWKSCDIEADPTTSSTHASSGLNLDNISGHRDGCATSCPGDSFYPQIAGIRGDVEDYIENVCAAFAGPSILSAQAISENEVALEWIDNSESEDNFILERSSNTNTDYQVIATLEANTTSYEDSNLDPFTAYFYRVKAVSGNIESNYSNEAGVATVITELEELSLQKGDFILYPNPTVDNLWVKVENTWKGNLNIKVIDSVLGTVLKTYEKNKLNNKEIYHFELNDLPAAIYFIEISGANTQQVFKIKKVQ